MMLTINNIGKIKDANIKLDGITVIAGENNSGKSTVGKVLFAVVNSLYRSSEQILDQREAGIYNVFLQLSFMPQHLRLYDDFSLELDFGNEIVTLDLNKYRSDKPGLALELTNLINTHSPKHIPSNARLVRAADHIIEKISLPDEIIRERLVQGLLGIELHNQINNLYDINAQGFIRLKHDDFNLSVTIEQNAVVKLEFSQQAVADVSAFYAGSPYLLDELAANPYVRDWDISAYARSHERHLLSFLYPGKKAKKSVADEIISERRLADIIDKLTVACPGEIKLDNGRIVYNENMSNNFFDLRNLSSGIKSFLTIKTLLLNNALKDGDILILDEPEVHLHPRWQVVFAELLVLLQQKMGLRILLSTHSSYFLQAIEVYSKKHGTSDKCKYYMAENVKDGAIISDITDNIDKVFEKLLDILQLLEDERYAND